MGIEAHINQMVKSMNLIAKELPKQIKDAKKNLSKEDIKKLDETMKQLKFDERLKELRDLPKDMETFMKQHYGG